MKIITGAAMPAGEVDGTYAESVWFDGGLRIPAQLLDRAQLIHSCDAPVLVELGRCNYLVTPQSALWIPAGIPHAVHALPGVKYVSLFIHNTLANEISKEVVALRMPPLLRELSLTAQEFKQLIQIGNLEQNVIDKIIEQLRALDVCKLVLPLPMDKRLSHIVSLMIESPRRTHTLNVVSEISNVSSRTLERIFKKETRMSYKLWQQHLLVIRAIDRLRDGIAVKDVAIEMGYQSPSSFISMFKRIIGITPSSFISGIIQ